MSGWRSLFAAMSPRMRHLVRWSLALMAGQVLALVARVVEFVLTSPAWVWVPTSVLMFGLGAPCIGLSLRMRTVRLAEDAEAQAERARRAEFLRLRAPDPLPGQCPVCAYDDLVVLGERDRDLEVEGTELARVVPYGPDRAHSECAAVVPYVPPPRSTSGGMTLGHAVLALDGRPHLCRCPQCERNRPRSTRGGYAAGDVPVSQMGPLPEVLTQPGIAQPVVNNTLRDSVTAQMDAHLNWAGSHSWENWQRHGFETRSEAAAWYRLGFTPWRAESWRQAGFTDPDAVARTGCTWPLFEPEREDGS